MTAKQIPFSSGTEAPELKAPLNACDCHHHIYDKEVAPAPGEDVCIHATVEDYRLLQGRIGTTRSIVVTQSNYGTNNEVILAALEQFGESARGVAVVDEGVTNAELNRLDRKGVRGIRFRHAPSSQVLKALSKSVADLGWHIQFNIMAKDYLVTAEALLGTLPSMLVFDHFARVGNIEDPAFSVVRRLIDKGRTWIKLSAAYSIFKAGAPSYFDAVTVGKTLVHAAPDRMIWGSDWPHPRADIMPDDAKMFDLNLKWAPDKATQDLILVRNPEVLYGFTRTELR